MKRFFALFLFAFIFAYSSYSFTADTTVTIGTVSVNAGENVLVPVTVTNFDIIGAIALKISFDHSKLTYKSLTNVSPKLSGMLANDDGTAFLGIAWQSVPEQYFGDSKLFDIEFQANSSSVGVVPICFDYANSAVTNYNTLENIPIVWTCGGIDVINGVKELNPDAEYNVYPNPSNGHFFINISKGDKEISIYSPDGKLVYNSKINNSGSKNSLTVDVPGISKGIYIMKITGSKNSVQKLVIN